MFIDRRKYYNDVEFKIIMNRRVLDLQKKGSKGYFSIFFFFFFFFS